MTRPTDQQIEAARVSDLGLILIADFDGLLPFVGHDETYGEFVVWLDCKGEEAEVKCACFLEGPPPESTALIPGIMRAAAAIFEVQAA